MTKPMLWLASAALIGSGALAYALVSGEKREDCPGKIICSVTGQEICKDRCPIVTKEERPSPVGTACCGSGK